MALVSGVVKNLVLSVVYITVPIDIIGGLDGILQMLHCRENWVGKLHYSDNGLI